MTSLAINTPPDIAYHMTADSQEIPYDQPRPRFASTYRTYKRHALGASPGCCYKCKAPLIGRYVIEANTEMSGKVHPQRRHPGDAYMCFEITAPWSDPTPRIKLAQKLWRLA